MEQRIATVRVDTPDGNASREGSSRPGGARPAPPSGSRETVAREARADLDRRLTRVLFTGSPRAALAGPGVGRLDARGWNRRGGEEALGRVLLEAADAGGLEGVGVGIADTAVAADVAAERAARGGAKVGTTRSGGWSGARMEPGDDTDAPARLRIVPSGGARGFLAPLPLEALPLPDELLDTLRALGLRRAGDLARLERRAVEARLGPEGVRAHRWARGEDDRVFPFRTPDDPPEASMELEGGVRSTEPLLFVLRQLLHRVCDELVGEGRCAARLRLRLELDGGAARAREAEVVPARPTRRETLLFDLCRATLDRIAGEEGLPVPVTALALRVEERRSGDARQGDLFAAPGRDPLRADAALSRLRARLGPRAVVRPVSRPTHRPEDRNAWAPVEGDPTSAATRSGRSDARPTAAEPRDGGNPDVAGAALPGVLRLLPEPEAVEVRCEAGRPVAVRDRRGRHRVTAAEGPERVSGDWWEGDPWAREYWWAHTDGSELLWLFREHRGGDGTAWRLHGWWD